MKKVTNITWGHARDPTVGYEHLPLKQIKPIHKRFQALKPRNVGCNCSEVST